MDEINLLDYVSLLMRRKRTIAAVTAPVLLIAIIVLAFMPKTYEGEATLLFPQRVGDSLSSQLSRLGSVSLLTTGVLELTGHDVYVSVLKSRTLSENVCKRLGLDEYDLDYGDLQDNLDLETPKEGGLVVTCRVPTSWLRGHVPKPELKKEAARLAARITNTYISELRTYDRANALFTGKRLRLYIEEQIARTKAELADAEDRLQEFSEQHPTLVPPQRTETYAGQSLSLAGRETESDIALQEVEAQIATARAIWNAAAPRNISPEAVIDSPVISELRTQLARLEVRRATLLEDFTETHPDVVGLTQEIEKTYDRIQSEVASIVAGKAGSESPAHQELLKQLVLLEVNRDGLRRRISALKQATSSSEERLANMPAKLVTYTRLLRDVTMTEAVYTTLLAEHAKARVAEGREVDNFLVLDDAKVPNKPAKPRVKLTLAAALIMGLMLGILIATTQGVPPHKR